MLLLTTSFLGYPLPRSHRHGGFEKKMFPSTSYSFLFQIKAVAHVCQNGPLGHCICGQVDFGKHRDSGVLVCFMLINLSMDLIKR